MKESKNKNVAAFFDIDGTIYRDSLLIEHFKMLVQLRKSFPSGKIGLGIMMIIWMNLCRLIWRH